MHKIKKGIKKKIKGKKGKDKEDDLFDPEQLAKYKLELEKAAAAAEGKQSEGPDAEEEPETSSGQAAKSHEEDEEWQKFKLLTSGIDNVLKKTSGDLDRIKSSSFFQRTQPNPAFILPTSSRPLTSSSAYANSADKSRAGVAPAHQSSPLPLDSKQKKGSRWVDLETGVHSEEEESDDAHQDTAHGSSLQAEKGEPEEKEPESPDVEPIDVDDDLFDTSFVDAVATGEIKLAYIPDSPTEEEEGDDPFDTSAVAHIVKKVEEEERKKKRQVNLGLAVNVLTGKPLEDNNNSQAATVKGLVKDVTKGTRRPRPRNINLLGDSLDADESKVDTSPKEETSPGRPTDLFDILLETSPIEAGDVVVPITKVSTAKETDKPEARNSNQAPTNLIHELLSEFDVISGGNEPISVSLEDDLEDEFAALAAQSIHKEPSLRSATQSPAPSRPPPPTKPPPPITPAPEEQEDDDPFDTTFVTNIPLGKSETKAFESEFLDGTSKYPVEDEDFDFDPRAGEEPLANLAIVQKDLLGGSSTDLSAVDPIRPESNGLIETEIQDPFDTSVVENLLPGRAELKLLEEELLTGVGIESSRPDEFDDFDPRKDETRNGNPSVTITHPLGPRRPPPPKVPEIHPLDITDESQSQIKALTPQTEVTNFEVQIDPFDTSSVSGAIVPGKFELRLLESELVKGNSVSDNIPESAPSAITVLDSPEFNPREEVPVASLVETVPQDIFDSPSHLSRHKPLTPTVNQPQAEPVFEDPFDTSTLVTHNIPGKAELKFLEKELLNSIEDFQPPSLPTIPQLPRPQRPLTPEQIREPHPLEIDEDYQDITGGHEPLKPLSPSNLEESLVFDDPFDTSIASTIAPGRTELKILEAELAFDSLSDPDFNPRGPPTLPTAPLVPQTLASIKASESIDIDPFDTSAADGILPGKAELKILEAELL